MTQVSSAQLLQSALAFHQTGQWQQAEAVYQQILQMEPNHIDALHFLGILYSQIGKNAQAVELINKAISIMPTSAMYCNLGNILKGLNQTEAALQNYQKSLALDPNDADVHYNLGLIWQEQGQLEAAIEHYLSAIRFNPQYVQAYYNLGMVFKEKNAVDSAIEYLQKAIVLKPDYADAHNNLGLLFQDKNEFAQAIECYQRALSFLPSCVSAYNNLGNVFQAQQKLDLAGEHYRRALAIQPDYAEAHFNLGELLKKQGQIKNAKESYQLAVKFKPDFAQAEDRLFYMELLLCDWTHYAAQTEKNINAVNAGRHGYNPFAFMAQTDSASAQQKCAAMLVADSYPPAKTPLWSEEPYQHDKIRIAYISANFREHAVSFLMAGLFEKHNSDRFEVIGISLVPEEKGYMGQRVKAAFDRFIEVNKQSDYEVALLIRQLEIDIAVDLMGFTQDNRTTVFSYRPAPIQINYLGYPATMGADYIDYIFADSYLIPAQYQNYYSEKVVYLPDCFQVNDDKRIISDTKSTRKDLGLPESGFIFCCFNNNYKISPVFFAIWMRLLTAVPNSVLWLVADNSLVKENLCNEAIKQGVNPERLVFASRVKYADHLARFQLADVFLDTLPFNAGTTASDALWAGVPVITCVGEAFASRMAGSLLNAIGLSELITQTLAEYEALALKLATTPTLLAEIRAKLQKNRTTYPLFDTDRFRRHIEAAYITMWERYQSGEAALSFTVQNQPAEPQTKQKSSPRQSGKPDLTAVELLSIGNQLQAQGDLSQAIEKYQKSIQIQPDFAEAHNNLGVVFQRQGNLDAAIECHQRAITLKPNYADAHRNLGFAFKAQGKLEAAINSYQAALSVSEDNPEADENLFFLQQECCDWRAYADTANKIVYAVSQGKPGYDPSILLAISDSAKVQQLCARTYVANEYPPAPIPLWAGEIYKHDKIRIAYLSADFYNHATAYLMAELFEAHDKEHFEIIAISFSPSYQDEMRKRLTAAFDKFVDVYQQSDYQIATLLRDLEIDIAVDLKGYTRHSRPGILAHRPAPIQVNYLGYPGTLAANYIDYILADENVIPPAHQAYYTEKVVYLPDSYQVNDSKRYISKQTPTRAEAGLPKTGFVFCCFNNNYKITPALFDSWMRLLNKVENSILWLLEDNPAASHNLKQQAMQHGIKPERLVFAPRVRLDAHLARQKLANLFLDTLPYNAHTTASDALWAGLPVLTCTGDSFASRVASSLLSAIGLPELITHNLADYEALALKLATTPALLGEIQTKLQKNRTTYPLFDTDRFRRHIETAYRIMWERYQRGEAPVSFVIQPIAQKTEGKPAYNVINFNPVEESAEAKTTTHSSNQAHDYYNQGKEFKAQGNLDAALASYQQAVALQPDYALAYYQIGNIFLAQRKLDAAIECYGQALVITPDNTDIYTNLGVVLWEQGKLDAAIAAYQQALTLKPDAANVHNNLGVAFNAQGKLEAAIECFRRAISYQPDFETKSMLFWTQQQCCDWEYYNANRAEAIAAISSGQYYDPLVFSAVVSQSPAEQLQCAQAYIRNVCQVPNQTLWTGQSYQHDKIRLAYISADFREHPTTYLITGLIEQHDRSRFEVIGISLTAENSSPACQRVKAAFDQFIVVENMSDYEIAALITKLEIDIAVDLMGFIESSRTNVFLYRPAPIQVNYLGFPGSMGTEYMDYILADRFVIPEEYQAYYTEKIVYLPDTYQVNDSKRHIAEYLPPRVEAGLPENSFVFCCFNNNHKITPAIFDIWMRLLGKVENSVLWLLEDNPAVSKNLRKAAVQHGITPERLIFAPRVRLDAHLARHKLADLFLDTLPYNAHTTASDALWAGLPVLTCAGESFASRVAGSLLNAIGLAELVTYTLAEYETLALKLATTPDLLTAIHAKLQKNRMIYPLFDTDRFRRHIEAAYTSMWERNQRGEAPVSFAVQAIAQEISDEAKNFYDQGKTFQSQNNLNAAIQSYKQALSVHPHYAQAYFQLGNLFLGQEKFELAIENYRQAVAIKPDFADAYCNLGVALKEHGEFEEAIENYRRALAIAPDDAEVYSNLGVALWKLNKLDAAIENYQRALLLNPNAAGVYNNLGAALKDQDKLEQAIENYQHALLLDPDDGDVYANLGAVFQTQGKLELALNSLKKAVALNPNYTEAFDSLFYTQLRCCDWSEYGNNLAKTIKEVSESRVGYSAFSFLALSDALKTQQQCAQTIIANRYPLAKSALWTGQRYSHPKIRIAYVSADLRDHAVSYLMAGLFEQHHRQQFEIIAISLTPEDKGEMGQRIRQAFDQFIVVFGQSDYEIASLMRELEIDIAVDLVGFTGKGRPGVFAYRPAPIHINYLGYPATMGANYMDYIIADAYLIPTESRKFYSEKVVYLPDCFQANDDKRVISAKKATRIEAGLPESGFVFCSFNNTYKISPQFFSIWMRLLKAVPNSVLWLIADNQMTQSNLRAEASKQGIKPERLVFTHVLYYPDHLARFSLADLFLDTLPFNAGTTASDALWAGVPVLTCSGEAFAARMAGSLLNAVGLSELITHNLDEYEALAFKLATNPKKMAKIRSKLAKNRTTYPLFNTNQFCRHLETAYIMMWERYQRGELPASFSVPPSRVKRWF